MASSSGCKANFFDQSFNGDDFSQYSSVILSQAEFDQYKSTGTQWWIVCSTLPPFSNSPLYVNTNGTVGIGVPSPQGSLQVNGIRPVIIKGNGGNGVYGSEIGFNSVLNTGVVPNTFKKLGNTSQAGGASIAVDYSGNMLFQMYNANTENESTVNYQPQIVFLSNGKVGIGTTSPDEELTVNGTIHTQEVRVDLDGPVAPLDYVFEENYDLPSLEEVVQYITINKHLPEIPSAKTMEEDGLNLKEMNLLLLKKVEELTLYLIELKKENEEIKSELNIIKSK
ncbi:MAG TPA: hypothetical protein VFW11_23270 [Cyclobacteriaceae bacterium]|nr:hypothetical protein [Cyclobacteriaceae bacterium]